MKSTAQGIQPVMFNEVRCQVGAGLTGQILRKLQVVHLELM